MQTAKLFTLTWATCIAVILTGCDSGITSDSEQSGLIQENSESDYVSNQNSRRDNTDFYAPNPAYDTAEPRYRMDYDGNSSPELSMPMEKNVYFKPELAGLTDLAENELANLAQNVKENITEDKNIHISVTAFTDTREADPYQEELSRLRAENVKEFLRNEGLNVSNWDVQTKDIKAADAQRDVSRAGENRSRLIVAVSHAFGRTQGS